MTTPYPETSSPAGTVVVLNRQAGGGTSDSLERKLAESFRTNGIVPSFVNLGGGADFQAFISGNQVGEDAVVVAGGGDGTISAVAAKLVGTKKTLGVLPLGTLNHFAKDLGIPLDLDEAVRTLAQGQVSKVDVGEVNGCVFINNSGLGIYPQIVRQREAEQAQRGSGKWPAFVRAALAVFRRYPLLTLSVSLNGKERVRRTPFVFVGNNAYKVAGLSCGSRSCLNAGKLGFYLANQTGRWGLLRLAVRALVGRLNEAKDFEAFCIDEARIDSGKHSVLVATDGEVTRMELPLHYRIRPGALRVLVPKDKTT